HDDGHHGGDASEDGQYVQRIDDQRQVAQADQLFRAVPLRLWTEIATHEAWTPLKHIEGRCRAPARLLEVYRSRSRVGRLERPRPNCSKYPPEACQFNY